MKVAVALLILWALTSCVTVSGEFDTGHGKVGVTYSKNVVSDGKQVVEPTHAPSEKKGWWPF